jgi:hypothetical protein
MSESPRRRKSGKKPRLSDKKLVDLYVHRRLVMREIAEQYGITRQRVQQRLAILGIRSGQSRTELNIEQLLSLRVDFGLSIAAISAKLQVSAQRVRKELNPHRIPRPKSVQRLATTHSREDVERLYIRDGLRQAEAAAKLGVSTSVFQHLLQHYGICYRHPTRTPVLQIDSVKLRELYVRDRRTIMAIARIFGCSAATIMRRLVGLGIPIERGRRDLL